ncbi:MAG: MarR family transcriptional regulator [Bacteroidetes bacterium]|nr:MarR family transcriptional regulator [Bacteroidota bacterium]
MKIDDEIKGRFRNDYHRGIINLTYTVNQLGYQLMQSIKAHGLTEPQYNVLRVLRGFRKEGPISINFIKERMLDKSSDVSRIVDNLLEKELIVRKESPNDRRQKEIDITEKGLTLLSDMIVCDKKSDMLLQNLSPDEVKELNRLLDKIRG